MKQSPLVLVLGAGGTVGRACVDYLLERGCFVLAGARHPERLPQRDSAHWRSVAVDITQAEQLPTLERATPDVVINCAGPAYLLSEPALKLCLAQRTSVFVDVGAEARFIQDYHTACQQAEMTAVIGAGVQPGLAGLSIRAAAHRLTGANKSLRSYIGGLQPLTTAGLADYLYAVQRGLSRPGQCWQQHSIRPLTHATPPPPTFPATASAHASLDEEGLFVAATEALAYLETYNVMDAPELAAKLHAAIGADSPAELPSCQQLNTCLFGRQPYFRITTTTTAQTADTVEQIEALAYCRDSYIATGQIAATAALWALAGKYTHGMAWFSAIAQPWQAWCDLSNDDNCLQLHWRDTPTPPDTHTDMETGTL